jgi:hypothetical protein
VTVTGTISGNTVRGQIVSGVTVTGTTAQFTSGTFVSLTGTTLQGTTATYTTGSFASLTGTTTSGTTANFVSGVFSTQISGVTVTGTTANFTSGNFTNISGGTHTITSGVFAAGTAANPSISFTSDPNTGIYSPGADQVAISTNGTGRLFVDSSGKIYTNVASATGTNTIVEFSGTSENSTAPEIKISTTSAFNTSFRGLRFGIAGDTTDYSGIRFQPSSGELRIESGYATYGGLQTFYTNGLERMRLDSSGRLGLGASSPAIGSPTLYALGSRGENGVVSFTNSSNSVDVNHGTLNLINTATGAVGNDARIMFSFRQVGSTNTLDPMASIGAVKETADNAAAIQFNTRSGVASYSEKVRITSGGNVGIGITSPSTALDVAGVSRSIVGSGPSFYALRTSDFFYSYFSADGVDSYTNTNTAAPFLFKRAGVESARIDSSGRLLVGTSTARANFFNATATTQLQIEKAGGGGGVSVVSDSVGDDPAILILAKSNNASLGGNTVVATDNFLGTVAFHGNDGTEFVDAARISCYVDGTPGANDMPGRLVFSTTADGASSPTERMRIRSTGAISMSSGLVIGGLGDPGSAIYITSDVITSGAGNSTLKYDSTSGLVTYDTSSRLVKENITDCAYGIEAIKQLQPRKYFRTDDKRDEIGFIADELINVLPEFVPVGPKSVITKNENDTEEIPLGVNYEKLTAVLTKALQEAVAKIEVLEQRLTDAGIA